MTVIAFLETPRFDERISYGSAGGPGFKTTVFTGHGGSEQRNAEWEKCRGEWNVAQNIKDKADMQVIRAFFITRFGKAGGFRFKDWSDYQLTDELIGTGDGVEDTFRLICTYAVGDVSYVKRIFKPVVDTMVVKVDGVTVPIGSGATEVDVDFTTGILVFGASVIPAVDDEVTVTCEFDVPVRFDTDKLSASHDGFQLESWASIPIVELPPSDFGE